MIGMITIQLSQGWNPLESLWELLGTTSKSSQRRNPSNLAQLHNSLMEEWLNIDVAHIQKLRQSISNQMGAVRLGTFQSEVIPCLKSLVFQVVANVE